MLTFRILFLLLCPTLAQTLKCPQGNFSYTQESHEVDLQGDSSSKLSTLIFSTVNPCSYKLKSKEMDHSSTKPMSPIRPTFLLFDSISIYAHLGPQGPQIHSSDYAHASLLLLDQLFPELWDYYHALNPKLKAPEFKQNMAEMLSDTQLIQASGLEQYLPLALHGIPLGSTPTPSVQYGLQGCTKAPGAIPLLRTWDYNSKLQHATLILQAHPSWLRQNPNFARELYQRCEFSQLRSGLWTHIFCTRVKDGQTIGQQTLKLNTRI